MNKRKYVTGYDPSLSPAQNEKARLDALLEWYECSEPERKSELTERYGFGKFAARRVSPLHNHPRHIVYESFQGPAP